jgi:hypothetical protein
MKKMVAMVAFATALMIGASAMAAPVDIFVRQTSASTWTIGAVAQVDNGQIALVALPGAFSSMTLAALPQISALDSIRNPGTGALTLTSFAGQDLVPIGPTEVVLATLNGPGFAGPCAVTGCGVTNGDDAFGFTVLNQALDTPLEYSLTVVPEPTTMVLFGLGLAALAAVRRSA